MLLRAHADAQVLVDARQIPAPDDDAPLAQGGEQCPPLVAGVADEEEVRRRRYNLEPEFRERRAQRLAVTDHASRAVVVPGGVPHRGQSGTLGNHVDGVGIEAVLDAHQGVDQFGGAESEAHAQPRKSPGLRQGLYDKQIVVLAKQCNGAFTAVVDIGLVDNEQPVRPRVKKCAYFLQRQKAPRRCVGVRQDHR